MCHHGTLVVADTIHAAFDEVSPQVYNKHILWTRVQVYYLERACMTQLLAMGAAGRDAVKEMPEAVQEATKATAVAGDTLDTYAAKHFYAKWNKYRALNSNVFQ